MIATGVRVWPLPVANSRDPHNAVRARVEFSEPGTYVVNGRPVIVQRGITPEQTQKNLENRDRTTLPLRTVTLRMPNQNSLGISTTISDVERADARGTRQDTHWRFDLNLGDMQPGDRHRMDTLSLERVAGSSDEYRVHFFRPGQFFLYGKDQTGRLVVLQEVDVRAGS